MSDNLISNDHMDNDPTDELPVLPEAAGIAASQMNVPTLEDAVTDTGEFTVQLPQPGSPSGTAATGDHRIRRDNAIEALEQNVAELVTRWSNVEQHLADNANAIVTLNGELSQTRQALDDSHSAQQKLINELIERDSRLDAAEQALSTRNSEQDSLQTEIDVRDTALDQVRSELLDQQRQNSSLTRELEQAQKESEALQTQLAGAHQDLDEMAQLRASTETLQAELDDNKQRLLQAQSEANQAGGTSAELESYQMQIESLSGYIENRRARWQDMEGVVNSQRERIEELEQELAQRVLREQRIEQMAHQESSRASELRTRLAALSATSPSHPTTRKTAAVMIEDKVTAAAQTTEQNDMLAEVQQKIDSLHKALKEQQALLTLREAQLNAAREDRNSLSERLTETKSDLDQSRNDLKRLEQNLVDRDRSVDDQGERIETLQSELSERLEALRNLQVKESASDVIDIKQARADAASSAADGADTRNATLLCLTSDMPEQHVITKPVTIIGRSAESDIQIVTHFVSREHARICKDRNGIVIENLGSTNGVFVNSIRVERQTLRHGDWVTIGETQFRFLEDGAE